MESGSRGRSPTVRPDLTGMALLVVVVLEWVALSALVAMPFVENGVGLYVAAAAGAIVATGLFALVFKLTADRGDTSVTELVTR